MHVLASRHWANECLFSQVTLKRFGLLLFQADDGQHSTLCEKCKRQVTPTQWPRQFFPPQIKEPIYIDVSVSEISLKPRSSSSISGLLFKHPDYATEALAYIERCWAIFQSHCKANLSPANDESMTCRDLLWLFKVAQMHCKRKKKETQLMSSQRPVL